MNDHPNFCTNCGGDLRAVFEAQTDNSVTANSDDVDLDACDQNEVQAYIQQLLGGKNDEVSDEDEMDDLAWDEEESDGYNWDEDDDSFDAEGLEDGEDMECEFDDDEFVDQIMASLDDDSIVSLAAAFLKTKKNASQRRKFAMKLKRAKMRKAPAKVRMKRKAYARKHKMQRKRYGKIWRARRGKQLAKTNKK